MIERYSLSPIREIWELEAQYERWLRVELAVIKAYEEYGLAPKGTAEQIREKTKISVEGIAEIEKVVDHDVIAFIKYVTVDIDDAARYFHLGLTSSDVVDTALSLAIKESGQLIIELMNKLSISLREKAVAHKETVCMGRTHGIHAEPTSFGLKLLSFMVEIERDIDRLKSAVKRASVGKLSGAVGNYANISPEIERRALEFLGIEPTEISTQVVPRDIHAEFVSALAISASSIERMAVEFRHLQRTEVLEVQEPFKRGQRGSSAMPHKKNPIISERLTGMARLMRGYVSAALEDITLWHERDISHSSVERVMLPDSTMLLYYMIDRAIYLVDNLIIYPERMLENFEDSNNLVFSQRVMISLIERGMTREDSYRLVQEISMDCWNRGEDFKKAIESNPQITRLIDFPELEELFRPEYYLRNVNKIFDRILNGG